ncbi:unnamed protein product [Amoebophrya sp. A120]|nr:unnamed protein product [Amoebophrya sp. A120]|eukprot:GSA120T00018601001.1
MEEISEDSESAALLAEESKNDPGEDVERATTATKMPPKNLRSEGSGLRSSSSSSDGSGGSRRKAKESTFLSGRQRTSLSKQSLSKQSFKDERSPRRSMSRQNASVSKQSRQSMSRMDKKPPQHHSSSSDSDPEHHDCMEVPFCDCGCVILTRFWCAVVVAVSLFVGLGTIIVILLIVKNNKDQDQTVELKEAEEDRRQAGQVAIESAFLEMDFYPTSGRERRRPRPADYENIQPEKTPRLRGTRKAQMRASRAAALAASESRTVDLLSEMKRGH